jgi:hypothetical protein
MFIQYAIEPFQGSRFSATLYPPNLHSGLFTLNHSMVFLGQRLGMDAANPMSLPHCGHRFFGRGLKTTNDIFCNALIDNYLCFMGFLCFAFEMTCTFGGFGTQNDSGNVNPM